MRATLLQRVVGFSLCGWLGATQRDRRRFPFWVKVVRSGSAFTGYLSPDGVNWTPLGGAVTIAMAQDVEIGLAVCSGSVSSLATATFDSVSLSRPASPAPVISSLSATTGSIGQQVSIGGSGLGATQGGSMVVVNGTPAAINSWSDSGISMTVPAGATSGFVEVVVGPAMNASNGVYFNVTANPLPAGWLEENLAASSSLKNSYGVSVAQEAREAVEQIRNRAERDSDPER